MTIEDQKWLRETLDLAKQGRGLSSPNPMVGAILVTPNGQVAGSGYHTYDGLKHAEIHALDQAGEAARGSTAYISLEPCCHQGRTPACANALISAGVRRVVAPLPDENPAVSGRGFARLREAGVEVEVAAEFAAEARKLNEPFFHFQKTRRPLVTLKCAVTLDGKIAAPDDNTGWITSEVARAHVQQVRHDHDAIMTGIGTVLADDCHLTDRTGLSRRRPLLRVVADSLLRIPLESQMIASFNDDLVLVATSAASEKRREALEALGIPILIFDTPKGRVDLAKAVEWLGEQHILSLQIEAGAKLNWAALASGIVDKVLLYYAPKILGGIESLPLAGGEGRRTRAGAIRLKNVKTTPVGPDEFTVEAYVIKEKTGVPGY